MRREHSNNNHRLILSLLPCRNLILTYRFNLMMKRKRSLLQPLMAFLTAFRKSGHIQHELQKIPGMTRSFCKCTACFRIGLSKQLMNATKTFQIHISLSKSPRLNSKNYSTMVHRKRYGLLLCWRLSDHNNSSSIATTQWTQWNCFQITIVARSDSVTSTLLKKKIWSGVSESRPSLRTFSSKMA